MIIERERERERDGSSREGVAGKSKRGEEGFKIEINLKSLNIDIT